MYNKCIHFPAPIYNKRLKSHHDIMHHSFPKAKLGKEQQNITLRHIIPRKPIQYQRVIKFERNFSASEHLRIRFSYLQEKSGASFFKEFSFTFGTVACTVRLSTVRRSIFNVNTNFSRCHRS